MSLVKVSLACGLMVIVTSPSLALAQHEAAPEAPRVAPQQTVGVRTQAGIGSNTAFARAGVVELGGSISASNADKYQEFSLTPSIGYFIVDNIQLSGLLSWHYGKTDGADAQNVASIVAEPSFHLPLSNEQFVFFGLGIGGLFQTNVKAGAAIAPRIGMKNLIGRSGMVTVDMRAIYGLNEANISTPEGTVLTVKSAYGIGIGYTVLL